VRAEALVAALEAPALDEPARVALLARGLQDPDPRVHATAAWGAGRARAAACLPALEASLASPNASVRREAVRAWGRIPGADRSRLLALAKDADPLVRSRVAELVE
jgi:HEAT repeat protein